MRIENSFQTCQFNWPATKKCIRFCRKIKLCHKQGKNKSRCHTQSHTHRHTAPGAAHAAVDVPRMPQHACRTFRACRLPLCGNKKFVYKQANMSREMFSVASPLPTPLTLLLPLPLLPLLLQHISQRLVRLPQVPSASPLFSFFFSFSYFPQLKPKISD